MIIMNVQAIVRKENLDKYQQNGGKPFLKYDEILHLDKCQKPLKTKKIYYFVSMYYSKV